MLKVNGAHSAPAIDRRSLAETAMFRMKTIFGGRLKNRQLRNQKSESRIRCKIRTILQNSEFQNIVDLFIQQHHNSLITDNFFSRF